MAFTPYPSSLAPNPNKRRDTKPLDPCNVFVKYLPSDLRDLDLESLFAPFGSVLSSKIMLDPVSRQSLGFGFVRFSHASEAQTAITRMDGHRLGAKRLLCKLANSAKSKDMVPVSEGKASSDESPRASSSDWPARTIVSESAPRSPSVHARHPSTNLYIKNLAPSDSEDTLRTLFGSFGDIETVKIMTCKHTGVGRGVGFVRFKELEQAANAIEGMHGRKYQDQQLVVQYADADERGPSSRKKRLPPTNPIPNAENTSGIAAYGSTQRPTQLEGRSDFNPRRNIGPNHFVPQGSAVWAPPPPNYHQGASPYAWVPPVYPAAIYDPQIAPQWMIVYSPNVENASYFAGASASGHPLAHPAGAGALSSAHSSGASSAGTSPLSTTTTTTLASPLPPFVTSLPPYTYPLQMYYPIDPTTFPPDLAPSFTSTIEGSRSIPSILSAIPHSAIPPPSAPISNSNSAVKKPAPQSTATHTPASPQSAASTTSAAPSASLSATSTPPRATSAQQVAHSVAVELKEQVRS